MLFDLATGWKPKKVSKPWPRLKAGKIPRELLREIECEPDCQVQLRVNLTRLKMEVQKIEGENLDPSEKLHLAVLSMPFSDQFVMLSGFKIFEKKIKSNLCATCPELLYNLQITDYLEEILFKEWLNCSSQECCLFVGNILVSEEELSRIKRQHQLYLLKECCPESQCAAFQLAIHGASSQKCSRCDELARSRKTTQEKYGLGSEDYIRVVRMQTDLNKGCICPKSAQRLALGSLESGQRADINQGIVCFSEVNPSDW